MTTYQDASSEFCSTSDNGKRYSNLNLNQNLKGSNIVHIKTEDKETTSDSLRKIELSRMVEKTVRNWNKDSSMNEVHSMIDKVWKKEGGKSWMTKLPKEVVKSTLSLHIAAYENKIEASSWDSFGDKDGVQLENQEFIKEKKQIFANTVFKIQNPFEFPRQQNDKVPEPELSKFKPTQKLVKPEERKASTGFHHVSLSTQEQFLQMLSSTRANGFKSQWNELARNEKHPCRAFRNEEANAEGKPDEQRKNRYKSIECNDNERVLVDKSNYFHGNYIRDGNKKKLFVATQGPTHASINDFWKMVIQEGTTLIIQLCEFFEDGYENGQVMLKQKCCAYYPLDAALPMKFSEFCIVFKESSTKSYEVNEEKSEFVTQTTLDIVDMKSKKIIRTVTHLQHRSWPDLGVPELTAPILDIYQNFVGPSIEKGHPVVAHCSAGIGRTGCFVAAYYCFFMFKKSRLVSVVHAIKSLRKSRARFVQRASQFFFLHILLINLIEHDTGKDLKKVKEKFMYLNKVMKEREARNNGKGGDA